MKKTLLAITFIMMMTGCATVVSGTQQSIAIETPHAEDAKCTLKDSKAGTWYLPATPSSVTVTKGNGPMEIVCKKAGYTTTSISVQEAFAGATLGNIILGGGIGIFIDAASGAAQKYPDKVVLWMKPNSFKSEAARKEWLSEKAEYERQMKEAAEAKRKAEQKAANQ